MRHLASALPAVALCAAGAFIAGCSGQQSVLDPAGPQAAAIARLLWLFTAIGAVVWLTVIVVMLAGLRGRRGQDASFERTPSLDPASAGERSRLIVVAGATGATTLVLFALLLTDLATGRELHLPDDAGAMTITVTGHQWWWDVRYEDASPARIFTTANEIHIPTGRPIRFRLRSVDVIHSFWVPNFGGKKDLIPGYVTTTWFQADREGVFRGQCAEFCGHQHAHMRLVVVAEHPSAFASWRAAQLLPAPEPRTEAQRRGREVFLGSSCVACHSIQGTPARGRVGPDLTHVASRTHLGAGTLATDRESLAAWITDPAHAKPGVRMPPVPLAEADLDALLAYLATLR